MRVETGREWVFRPEAPSRYWRKSGGRADLHNNSNARRPNAEATTLICAMDAGPCRRNTSDRRGCANPAIPAIRTGRHLMDRGGIGCESAPSIRTILVSLEWIETEVRVRWLAHSILQDELCCIAVCANDLKRKRDRE